jgi:hypothetical protein
VPKEARRGPAMRTWSGAARYGRSSGSPRKSSPICTAPSNDGTCSATRCDPVITPSTIFSPKWKCRYRRRRCASLFELDAANFVEGPLTRFDEFDDEFLARYRSLWEAAQRFMTRQAYAAVIARLDVLAEKRRADKPATA